MPRKTAKKQGRGGARPGSGRPALPPEERSQPVSASVPGALVRQLDELCERRGWSRSRAVTEAIAGLVK